MKHWRHIEDGTQPSALTRRDAIRGIGIATVAALGIGARSRGIAASDRAAHPMIGHWLATTPLGPAHVVFDAEGGALIAWPHSEDDDRGTFPSTTSATGFWQPVSARGIHFMAVQIETEPGGVVTGATSLNSIVVASTDGASFRSAGATEPVTAWASVGMTRLVLRTRAAEPALSGIRMWPED
jgi:hypothetical protein